MHCSTNSPPHLTNPSPVHRRVRVTPSAGAQQAPAVTPTSIAGIVAAPPGKRHSQPTYTAVKHGTPSSQSRNADPHGDLHTRTAQILTGSAQVSRDQRQRAKAINFGMLFGMGAPSLQKYALESYGVTLTDQEAEAYHATFRQGYPGLTAWQRRQEREHPTETRTLAGRRRILAPGDPKAYTRRLNTPIQGTGADGLKMALALLWERRSQCPGAFPIIVCHDEIVVECDEEQATAAAAWLQQAMIDGMQWLIPAVPVEAEPETGRSWAMVE